MVRMRPAKKSPSAKAYLIDHPSGEVIRHATVGYELATGELLSAHQAAKRLGMPTSTFNYHLKRGHINYLSTPSGVNYVRNEDADYFFERLKTWRKARVQSTAWPEEEFDIAIPSIPTDHPTDHPDEDLSSGPSTPSAEAC